MTRTKIVCTIGPASSSPSMLQSLMLDGMDVARINLSHGDWDFHTQNIANIRAAAHATNKPVAIIGDLQGPKIRVGQVAKEGIPIHEGETIILTTRPVTGERLKDETVSALIPIGYDHLPQDVTPGERVLIDDGLMEVEVESADDTDVYGRVITGGIVRNRKGLNLPGTKLSLPAITEKDWQDLDFLIQQKVDWIALSFVRTAQEIQELKAYIEAHCPINEQQLVLAKIEKPQALETIDEILEAADGIMVARGDLGIEIPAEKLPLVQKRLIRLANTAGKPVITATQMLDSMIRNPRPTRAEASDVANALLDGTDAIMLSGETAVGKYPQAAVRTMVRIAQEIENSNLQLPWIHPPHIEHHTNDVTDAVSHATCETAYDLNAAAIIASTASGKTARSIAKYRPQPHIAAVTPHPIVQRQLMLSWGVTPIMVPHAEETDKIIDNSLRAARDAGLVNAGDRVIVTAGVTINMPGTTNLMSIEMVPEMW